MTCPNCGEEISEGMKFCGMCGTPLVLNKKCINCGMEMPIRMKFCPECGTPQTVTSVQKKTGTEPISEPETEKLVISQPIFSEEEEFLTVEKIEFDKIKEQFNDCGSDNKTLLTKLEQIYAAHRTNRKVLEIYLPLLAETKEGAERALDIVGSLNKDILSVYLIAVDIGIELNNLTVAESYLNRSKKISQNEPLVLCRECCLMLAMYKQYKTQSFLDNAIELSKTISEIQTTDIIVKSWQLRIMSLIMKQNGEKAPCFDLDFCKENNLIYRIVAWMDAIRTTEELKETYTSALPNETLLLKPGTYQIDFPLDKAITIKGFGETILNLTAKLQISADIRISGIKFTGSDDDTIGINGSAKPQFQKCIFEKCGLKIVEEAVVSLFSCEIYEAIYGIKVTDGAAIYFTDGKIHDIKDSGIDFCFSMPSRLESVQISNCNGNGIDISDSEVEIIACTVTSTEGSGIYVRHNKVKIRNCKVQDIVGSGFYIEGDESVITNCEAYRCKVSSDVQQQLEKEVEYYWVTTKDIDGFNETLAIPQYPITPAGTGFFIRAANVVLENCKSYTNDCSGYKIVNPYSFSFKGCEAFTNVEGFLIYLDSFFEDRIEENSKRFIEFEHCKSCDNKYGFHLSGKKELKEPFTALFKECEAYRNSFGNFSKADFVIENRDQSFLGNKCSLILENCKSDDDEREV